MAEEAITIDCSGPQVGNQLTIGSDITNVSAGNGLHDEERGFRVSVTLSLRQDFSTVIQIDYSDLDEFPIEMFEIPIGLVAGDNAAIIEDIKDWFQIIGSVLSLKPGVVIPGINKGSVILRAQGQKLQELAMKVKNIPYKFQRANYSTPSLELATVPLIINYWEDNVIYVTINITDDSTRHADITFYKNYKVKEGQVEVKEFDVEQQFDNSYGWQKERDYRFDYTYSCNGRNSATDYSVPMTGTSKIKVTLGSIDKCSGDNDVCVLYLNRTPVEARYCRTRI